LPANVAVRLEQHERQQGKGAAIRTGCLAARGEYVFFIDADLATHDVRTAPTNETGDYLFNLLPIGTYTVNVELQGFASQTTRVVLSAGDRVRFDPRSGQTVLALDTIDLTKAAQATLATGLVRPLQPPAEQAEVWFERASEWDADPVQWEDAIAAYRRVIAIDPTYAAAWNNLGLLLHRMGQYEDARKAYASALAQDPQCAEAAYNLGSLDEDMGAVEEAIEHYRCALTIKPDYADAHFNLAAALARSGRGADAIGHWQRYLQLDAGSPWARIARAHLEVVEPPEGSGSQ